MTSVTGAIRTRLLQDSGIAGVVGSKIFATMVPPGTAMPAVTMLQIGGRENNSHDGRTGNQEKRIQISCWSNDYDEAFKLRRLVKSRLVDFRGVASGVTVNSITHAGEYELRDPELDAFVSILDVDVNHEEEPWI